MLNAEVVEHLSTEYTHHKPTSGVILMGSR